MGETIIRAEVTIDDRQLGERLHGLLEDIEGGNVRSIAFVAPSPMPWLLPIYELALMTAGRAHEMGIELSVTIVTPEDIRAGYDPGPSCSSSVAPLCVVMLQSIQQSMPSGMPNAFTTCLEQKMNATKPSELASLLFPASATQPGAAQARGRQLGIGLAEKCLAEPAMRPVLLGMVLGPVERDLNAGHYSTAFKNCLLGKLRKVPSFELVRRAADPAAENSFGIQLGRSAAEACIASGAKP